MIQHELFIEQLEQMHLNPATDQTMIGIIHALRLKTLSDLEQKQKDILKQLESVSASETLQDFYLQVSADQKKIQSLIEQLRADIAKYTVSKPIQEAALNDPSSTLWTDFNQIFAGYFPNLELLIHTLSDAPAAVKAQLMPLTTLILDKLTDLEQKKSALRALSNPCLKEIIEQSLKTYDELNKTHDPANESVKLRCKSIVQLSIAELVHRECEHATKATIMDYANYTAALDRIQANIPDVKASDILDDISENHPEIEADIKGLLLKPFDWKKAQTMQALTATQNVYQDLKFGQKDFREYVTETQQRLATDLFWAENIYETRLFPADERDKLYHAARESNQIDVLNAQIKEDTPREEILEAFATTHEIKRRQLTEDERDKCNRILWAFKKTKDTLKTSSNSSGIIIQKIFFDYYFETPQVLKTGSIPPFKLVMYQSSSLSDLTNTNLSNAFKINGALNCKANTFAMYMMKSNINFLNETQKIEITGNSLEDIQTKALERGIKLNTEYLRDHFPKTDISNELSPEENLRLSKILELYQFKTRISLQSNAQLKYLSFLDDSLLTKVLSGNKKQTKEALLSNTPNLDQFISSAYQEIANLNPSLGVFKDDILHTILMKAKKIAGATERKQAFNQQLESALSIDDYNERRDNLIKVYQSEYNTPAILETLGLKNDQQGIEYMNKDIVAMAYQFMRLMQRSEQGLNIIDESENQAYFSLIQQIANGLPEDLSMQDIGFKLSHNLKLGNNELKIQTSTRELKLNVNLTYSLPYSLIKPIGYDDFELSMGGSRGVVAPYAGLDTAYGRSTRKQGFRNFLLVGEGQQGTVKALRNFITQAGSVLKKVYLTRNNTETFNPEARKKLETLPISARDDSQYAVEADVLVAQSSIAENHSRQVMSYQLPDKERHIGKDRIFKAQKPEQGYLIMPRAPGRSQQQMANDRLKLEQRDQPKYHNPTADKNSEIVLHELQDMLSLSSAVLDKAQQLSTGKSGLTVTHNDIKPENFNAERRPDGSWNVNFTDWGTGGFAAKISDTSQIPLSFGPLFSEMAEKASANELNGRFIKRTDDGQIEYGVNPQLQILGGKFHCTLPYISPQIFHLTDKSSIISSISATDETLDNWALTAMLFGVCNTRTYLALSKGRANQYYAIPGIIEERGDTLEIVDNQKFGHYFGVKSNLEKDAVYNINLMYIPGNSREGEPFHLYRRLSALAQGLDPKKQANEIEKIQAILTKVSDAVTQEIGLDKATLTTLVQDARHLIQTLDPKAKAAAERAAHNEQAKLKRLTTLWADPFDTHEDLRPKLKDLCTLPADPNQIKRSQEKLQSIIGTIQKNNYTYLLKECIEARQEAILITLLDSLVSSLAATESEYVQKLINDQDLFDYALQEGLTQGAKKLYSILTPEHQQQQLSNISHQAPWIKWQGSALEIAIRRNDATQLEFLLQETPRVTDQANKKIIDAALHASATLSHHPLFAKIKTHFSLTDASILAMNEGGKTPSPYHWLLRSTQALDTLPWDYWQKNTQAAKDFLLTPSPYTPCLMAAEAGNIEGLMRLIYLGQAAGLSADEWIQLFTLRDADAKNIANYLSENQARVILPSLITRIKNIPSLAETHKAEILKQLLFNSAPHNPVANELNRTDINAEKNIAWMAQLQTAILPGFGLCRLDPEDTTAVQRAFQAQPGYILHANTLYFVEVADNTPRITTLKELESNNELNNLFPALGTPLKMANSAELEIIKSAAGNTHRQIKPQSDAMSEVYYELLLNNQSWLIKNKDNPTLKTVMMPSSVDWRYPYHLATILSDDPELSPEIKEYYKKLAADLSAQHPEEAFTPNHQAQFMALQTDLSRRTADISEVLKELSQANVDRLRLQQELDGLKTKVKAQESTLLSKNTKIFGIKNSIEVKNQELTTALQEVASLRNKIETLAQDKETQIKQLSQELVLKDHKVQQLTHEVVDLKSNLAQLKQSKQELDTQINHLKAVLAQLEKEKSEYIILKNNLETNKQSLAEAKQQKTLDDSAIRALEEKSDDLSKQLIQSQINAKALFEQIESLQQTNDQLKARVSEQDSNFSSQLSEMSEKLTLEHRKASEADDVIKQLQNEKDQTNKLTMEVSSLTAQVSQLTDNLAKKSLEADNLTIQLEKIQKMLNSLQETGAEASKTSGAERDKLIKEIDQIKHELDKQTKGVSDLTRRLEEAQAKYELLTSEHSTLKLQNTQLENDISSLKTNLQLITDKARQKEDELQATLYPVQQQLEHLQKKFDSVTTRLKKQKAQSVELTDQLEKNKQRLTEATQQKTRDDSTIRDLQKERETLSKKFIDSQISVVTLFKQIETLQESNDQLNARVSEQDSNFSSQLSKMSEKLKLERLKAREADLEQNLSDARVQISDLNAQVNDLGHNIQATTVELNIALEASDQLRETLLEVRGNLDKNLREQAILRSDLTFGAQENAQLRERLAPLEIDHTNLMQRQESLLKDLHVQKEKNEVLTARIQDLETKYDALLTQYEDTTEENVVLNSLLTGAHDEIDNLRPHMQSLTRELDEKDLKIGSLEEQLAERDVHIRDIENQCQALHDSLQEQLRSGATPQNFDMLRVELDDMAQLYRDAHRETDLLRQENAALHDAMQRQDAMKLRGGGVGGTAMRSDEASDTNSNQTDKDDVELVVKNLGAPSPDASLYPGSPSRRQWPRSDSDHTTDADSDSRHPKKGGKSGGDFFGSNLRRQSYLYNNPRRRPGSGRDNSDDDLYDVRRRDKPGSYDSDDDLNNGLKRKEPRRYNRSKQSNSYLSGNSRKRSSEGYDSDDSSSDGPKRYRSKDSGRDYGDSIRIDRPSTSDIPALGARTARVSLHGRERELRDVQADIAIAIGNYAEIMSNRNPSKEDMDEVEANKKILFIFQSEPVGLQIGYRSNAGEYLQEPIKSPTMHTLLEDEYRDLGDGVVLDPEHLKKISTYLTTTLGLPTSPVENPHPGFTNTIYHGQYVRLNAIDTADLTKPPKRLLDAKLNDVVVYRRLISDPGRSPEWKAQTILKSMGIPPQPQFDFPAALEIDGRRNIADFEADSTKNPIKYEVIKQMFELYNKAKIRYDNASCYSPGA